MMVEVATVSTIVSLKNNCQFDNYIWSSIDYSTIKDNHSELEWYLGKCVEYGITFIGVTDWDEECAKIANEYNIKVAVYTFNDYQEITRYLDMGVSFVFSDSCLI